MFQIFESNIVKSYVKIWTVVYKAGVILQHTWTQRFAYVATSVGA